MTLLEGALSALDRGLSVFPLQAKSKDPYTREFPFDSARPYGPPHGVKHATRSALQVKEWWAERPDSNVGVTGQIIVDVDAGCYTLDDVKEFARERGLPETLVIHTGRSECYGAQFHFSGLTSYMEYQNGPFHGEIRTGNLYGIFPPSIHPNGRTYEIAIDAPIAEWKEEYRSKFTPCHRESTRMHGEEYEAVSIQDARDIYSRLLSRARHAVKGGRNHNANILARFAARGLTAGIFKEFALFNGEVVLHAMTEKEIRQQISDAIEPLYRDDRRDWRSMLRYSWRSGLQAGPLALTITHDDYIKIQLLSDDTVFQEAWDGRIEYFNGDAIAAKAYLQRSLIQVGITDVQRVLNSSGITDAVAKEILFDLKVGEIIRGSESK
jgi:hypothetical protein